MPNSRRPSPSSRRAAAPTKSKSAKHGATKTVLPSSTSSHAPTGPAAAPTSADDKPLAGKRSSEIAGRTVGAASAAVADNPSPAGGAEPSGAGRPIVELKNLGPNTAEWLAEVGIHEQGELARLGSLEAFRLVAGYLRKRGEPAPTLNLLFALEGALSDTHWARLPGPRRRELQEQGTAVLREGSGS